MDHRTYVNIFQGCGEIDLPQPEGIAAKWFFLKAGCGNTSPAACLPFSAMSVSPYSGGYPTGYGDHLPNSHSRPAHFEEGKKLLGFAHIQQSGTGAIGYYYNYALTVPYFDSSPERRIPEEETARPGYYFCLLEGIRCELTVSGKTALHRYLFPGNGGKVRVDLFTSGLCYPGCERKTCSGGKITAVSDSAVTAEGIFEGIPLCFALHSNGKIRVENGSAILSGFGNCCNMKLSVSLKSTESALRALQEAPGFDEAAAAAGEQWEQALSVVDITTEKEELKEIFYSNLYHSFVKPADFSGESFVYENGKPFVIDLATLWDMYKTALPLIFMTQKEIGEKTAETLLLLGETLGDIPNSIGISDSYSLHSEQARMLGAYALITAYRYGVKIDPKRMAEVITRDVFADNKKDFTVDGRCRSHTWLLDMADACALTAEIALENGQTEIAEKLLPLSRLWKTVYSPETGLLKDDSQYYEGTLYNYSFRQMVHMEERIALAGGKERFTALLDQFFGYGAEDTVQPTDPHNYEPVEKGMQLGRFEGFNNESDTEAPFSYIYAGRQDRTCEILRSGMKSMFTTGRGGLPGNNDSDALSSYFVFAALGIFPVAGQDLFLIGSPLVDGASVKLFNGRELRILAENNSDKNIYVKSVQFNGKELTDFMLPAKELMNGGTLKFIMEEKSSCH